MRKEKSECEKSEIWKNVKFVVEIKSRSQLITFGISKKS